MKIRLEVFCDGCRLSLGVFYGSITEKYPFDCPECGDIRMYKWPWYLTATIEE